MMTRISVPLSQEEWEPLYKSATDDLRGLREQARWLLRRELERLDLLPPACRLPAGRAGAGRGGQARRCQRRDPGSSTAAQSGGVEMRKVATPMDRYKSCTTALQTARV
jgi:hypothetical protein